MARSDPTGRMFPPGTVGRGLTRDEALYELFQGNIWIDVAFLQVEVVLGNRYVTRIADQVDDFPKTHLQKARGSSICADEGSFRRNRFDKTPGAGSSRLILAKPTVSFGYIRFASRKRTQVLPDFG